MCVKSCIDENGGFKVGSGLLKCAIPCVPGATEKLYEQVNKVHKKIDVICAAKCLRSGLKGGKKVDKAVCLLQCVRGLPELPFEPKLASTSEVVPAGILDNLPIESIVGKIDNLPIEEAMCVKSCIDANGGFKVGNGLLKCAIPCVPGASEKIMEVVSKVNTKVDVMCTLTCAKDIEKGNFKLENAMCLLGCAKELPELPFTAVA